MMCDARLFQPQINALSLDMPVMVAPITRGERIEEIASDVLSAAPAKFALAGLSMGRHRRDGGFAPRARPRDPVSHLMDTNPAGRNPAVCCRARATDYRRAGQVG